MRRRAAHGLGAAGPHVPHEGRAAIHERFIEADLQFTWHEFNGAHAFLRDEGARYDPELALISYRLALDLLRRRLCG